MICLPASTAQKLNQVSGSAVSAALRSRLDASVQPYLDFSPMRAAPAQSTEASMSSVALDSPVFRIPTIEELGFDPQAVRRKYDFERDKRLRPDGPTQYREVAGQFEHFKEDPYITSKIVREPVREDIEVAILGGGFGGMLIAARLQQEGIRNFRIIEKAGDFGGTWYWNRYPGAQCDVESYIYLPLLEETGYVPKEKYSFGPEIYEHAQRIGRFYDLYSRAYFQTQVKHTRWNEGP
jgi:cyclohexanone monooxygenase